MSRSGAPSTTSARCATRDWTAKRRASLRIPTFSKSCPIHLADRHHTARVR